MYAVEVGYGQLAGRLAQDERVVNMEKTNLGDEKLPAVEQVRQAVKMKIGRFTKSEIMELCPWIGKTSVENSLKALAEESFITPHGQGKATYYTRNK